MDRWRNAKGVFRWPSSMGRKRPGTNSSPELETWRRRDPQWETGGRRLHGTLVMDNSRPDNPPGAIEERANDF